MKQYKLLKDLPTIEAGRIFEETKGSLGGTLLYATGFCSSFTIDKDGIKNFDEWFEEVHEESPEPKKYYHLSYAGDIIEREYILNLELEGSIIAEEQLIENLKAIGNYFKTREEAEKYLEYLKAKAAIKEDTKGFKPDWTDKKTRKYYGYWDFERGFKNYFEGGKPSWDSLQTTKESNIYFESWEDIEESFEKHPKEWKTYLTYER